MISINHPDNKEFLAKCELLEDYKQFGDIMSDFISHYGEKGYDLGIAYCIEHGILADFLSRHIKEMLNMLKAKYNYKDEIRVLTQEAREEGWESGRAEVVRTMKSKGFSAKDIADILSIKEEVVESM